MTAYDALLARRSAALGVVLAVVVFLVMLGTDDAASTHAGRLGRLSALSSMAGAGGAFLALGQARSRGEMRALAATGLSPVRATLGAVAGGALVGLLGAALALVPGVDLTPLFPRALAAEGGWVAENGAWIDPARGIRIAADGAVGWAGAPSGAAIGASSLPVSAMVIALALGAVAFPLWAATRGKLLRRGLVSFAVAAAAVFVFHLVAAHRIGAMMLVLPPLLLLFDTLALHRRREWS